MPHQHKITAPVLGGLFDGAHVRGGFHHAQQMVFACRVGAEWADFGFTEGAALAAMSDPFCRLQ